MNVKKELRKYSNSKFKEFQSKLIPNINNKTILGVKSIYIKKISKNLYYSNEHISFINDVPHNYLEENLVHVQVSNLIKDYELALLSIKKLLPYMDNWMVTDTVGSKTFEKNKDKLIIFIRECLNSKKPYTIRLGILLLKKYYLGDSFDSKSMNKVVSIKNDNYYVKMMQAWYIAEGLAKNYNVFLSLVKKKKLDPFVQNKAIQKARESYRISKSTKNILLKYKV